MSEIEKRQLDGDADSSADGTASFAKLIEGYHPDVPFPPISHTESDLPQNVPDIINQDRISNLKAKLGTIPQEALVSSVYDARPINAIDFTQILKTDGVSILVGANTASFIVPPNYIMVMKNFTYDWVPNGLLNAFGGNLDQWGNEGGGNSSPVLTITIAVDGVPVSDYTNLALGSYVYKWPCYILADQNSVVSFTFGLTLGAVLGLSQSIMIAAYGQFLLASGRPINFEPGNIPTK